MKICIIKLGADGDVLRTLPLAKAIHRERKAEITWITKGDIATLIEGLPYVQRVIRLEDVAEVEGESFDALYNFDTEKDALELAEKIKARGKYGFKNEGGYPAAYNTGSEYYLNTMFDDELKKTNRKTYQEMMFDVAEQPYKKERYELALNEEDKKFAKNFSEKKGLAGKKVIGIHMGASSRWPSKVWHPDRVKEFIRLAEEKGFAVLLFGGPNEVGKHEELVEELKVEGIEVFRNNPANTKREFAALVSVCDFMVCGDSFALHVALGLGVMTIGLFFVTSPDEVEGYGLLTKIAAPRLADFFPERSDEYDEELVRSIGVEEVMDAVEAKA